MENIKTIAEFFLVSLAWCLTLFSPLASCELTGNGFIKLISNVAIGAIIVSFISSFQTGLNWVLFLKLAALLALIAISIFHRDQKTMGMWTLYLLIVIFLGARLVLLAPHLSDALFLLSSSLLLGVITYSMLLGHWYLVVPKLSERPLLKAALLTWMILAGKMTGSFYSTYKHYDFFESQTTLGSGYAFNWLLLTMRFSFGYLVILGMSLFNWKLVRIRSIQSSTGILYAMTFFIFIGELISTYLFFSYGLYI